MREIKFRAWDKEQGRLYYNAGTRKETGGFNYPWGFQTGIRPIEIMQYTGLKDKNGKEIYEGDIVKIHWLETGSNRPMRLIHEVKWNGNGYGNVFDSPNMYKIHIIGNIYENPELLRGLNG